MKNKLFLFKYKVLNLEYFFDSPSKGGCGPWEELIVSKTCGGDDS